MDDNLVLVEAISSAAGPLYDHPVHGRVVDLHVIRPGIGRGRGKHLYEADMLEREASEGRFDGWKMYVDHDDAQAKKSRAGLPRSMKDLGGIIKEARWDPNVPADPSKGHGKGAVVAIAKPTRFMADLVEAIPEACGASIAASATAVRPVVHQGESVLLVEGIRPRGSVDWVTEAGAGGKVVALRESLQESMSEEDLDRELLECLTDDEVREYLSEARPELYEELKESIAIKEAEVKDVGELLKEALEDEEQRGQIMSVLSPLIEAATDARVEAKFNAIVAPKLVELVEAAMGDAMDAEREVIQAEAVAGANRMLLVRDLRDIAHKTIEESKLPEKMQAELKARYDIVDDKPTPGLDVVDVTEGDVTKKAVDVLTEALAADLTVKREQAAELRPPTRVTRQGGAPLPDDLNESEEAKKARKEQEGVKTTGSRLTDALLQEAGIDPSDDIYAGLLG